MSSDAVKRFAASWRLLWLRAVESPTHQAIDPELQLTATQRNEIVIRTYIGHVIQLVLQGNLSEWKCIRTGVQCNAVMYNI